MQRQSRGAIAVLFLAILQLTACRQLLQRSEVIAADEERGPAKIEHLEGAEPARVTLTEKAVKRLDITTEAVRDMEIEGKSRKVIPYAAVLYDTEGDTWTYTSLLPGVFIRHHVTVDHIVGDQAVLVDGPASGTRVVTVGAAELYGSESEFEEE